MQSCQSRTYEIPFAPVSHNQAYSTRVMRRGGKNVPIRYMQTNYKAFKALVKEYLAEIDESYGGPLPFEPPLAVCFLFLMEKSSFFYKKGTVKRRDVTDFFKLVEDACSEHWGIDDCHNYLVLGHKRWVEDGQLPEFVEDAYDNPPHKSLVAIIKIKVQPIPKDFGKWDGNIVPEVPFNVSTTPV